MSVSNKLPKYAKVVGDSYTINPQWEAWFRNFANASLVLDATSTGFVVQNTSASTVNRTITTGTGLSVANGDGVSGNPSIAISDVELLAIAGLTSAANKVPYFTGSGTASLADFTSAGRALVDDADAATQRTTLGLGSAATQNVLSSTKLSGLLNTNITQVGSVSTSETNLITYSMAGNSLANDKESIEILAFGTFAATANNKTIKLYFGSTVILTSGAAAANNGSWCIRATVMRTGAATQLAIATLITDKTVFTNIATTSTPAETLSSAVTIKCTGTATADNDVVQKGLIINWNPAV